MNWTMIELISPERLDETPSEHDPIVIDARPVVRYLAGHIPGAVSLPASRLFDPKSMELKAVEALAEEFGRIGVSNDSAVVVGDSFDGQNAAILAWTLEYLGHEKTQILSSYVESWTSLGRELLYRPVKLERAKFVANSNPNVRATLEEVRMTQTGKLVDFRSAKEFTGELTSESRAGHLPDAINLPWTDLLAQGYEFLKPKQDLAKSVERVGLGTNDGIVAYCNYGPRAAVGFIALQQLGFEKIRVYDGSFHQWALHPELPVHTERPTGISTAQNSKWEEYILPGC
jgi:thiosulfate/3-mercaptopyruvate sulfurtransferase